MALLVAIALSIFGVAYAHWSDMAYIDGVVEMGGLTPAFTIDEAPSCAEYYPNPDPPPILLPGEVEDKDVGECRVWYSDLFKDVHSGKEGYRYLNIWINNSYPQYHVHTTFILHNIGTIPFYFYGIAGYGEKIDYLGNLEYDLLVTSWIDDTDKQIYGEIWEDINDDGKIDPAVDILVINLKIKNKAFPLQIDPCFQEKMEIDVDFKQEAQQCHTYYLHLSLLVIQWNKLYEVYP
jgi:hypothetical protein